MKHPVKKVGLKHFDWVGLVLETDLPMISKAIVMYLSRFMTKDQHVAWPSRSRIQAELTVSKGALNKHLDLLESEGWISRINGNSTTNTRYWIAYPKCIETSLKLLNNGSSLGEPPSSRHEQRSSPDEPQVVHEVNTNSPLNNKTNNYRSCDSGETDMFDTFWASYPKKESKKQAKIAFNRLSKNNQKLAIQDSSNRYDETDKRFIPLPTTYLNGERWNDEITEPTDDYGRGGV